MPYEASLSRQAAQAPDPWLCITSVDSRRQPTATHMTLKDTRVNRYTLFNNGFFCRPTRRGLIARLLRLLPRCVWNLALLGTTL